MNYSAHGILCIIILWVNGCLTACNERAPIDTSTITGYFNHSLIALEQADDLDELINAASRAKLILLGEASHGTLEFYTWRAEISKRLIVEHNYNFIAVEGDWASIYRLNAYVKNLPGAAGSAKEVLSAFDRWPEWMWGNETILELAEWLRAYNDQLSVDEKVGFYGKDVYGQWEAMDRLLEYASQNLSPAEYEKIKEASDCFARFNRDEWSYAREYAQNRYSCNDKLSAVAEMMEQKYKDADSHDAQKKMLFKQKQNALVLNHAEDFFRLATYQDETSWNSRANHMWQTVQKLFDFYGAEAKGIVWAHNTHVGDARFTAMQDNNMENIGALSRNDWGESEVFIVGFGTCYGLVNAGFQWGTPMQIMEVPVAREGSIESLLCNLSEPDFYLVFDEIIRSMDSLQVFLPNRAIGVVYNPTNEAGNYVPTIFPRRYDAFVFIRETKALTPVK